MEANINIDVVTTESGNFVGLLGFGVELPGFEDPKCKTLAGLSCLSYLAKDQFDLKTDEKVAILVLVDFRQIDSN